MSQCHTIFLQMPAATGADVDLSGHEQRLVTGLTTLLIVFRFTVFRYSGE